MYKIALTTQPVSLVVLDKGSFIVILYLMRVCRQSLKSYILNTLYTTAVLILVFYSL